ncbi:MAG: rhomboid family intramembrane serine protease [Mangrovibacterium sp.]
MSLADEIKESFERGSVLTRLLYVNIGIFLCIRIIHVFFFLLNSDFPLLDWLALPSDLSQLAHRPWTLFSYMFLHFNFLHILFNLLWLYWMGKIFLIYFDEKKLLGVYLLGGLTGGAFFVLAYNLFPAFSNLIVFSRLLGASASVLAIIAAVATHAPDHMIQLFLIGRIRMKHLALISIVLYVIGIASSNAGGNLAHLGGAAFGYLYALRYRQGHDLSRWVSLLAGKIGNLFKPKQKVRLSYRGKYSDIAYNRNKNMKQEEINRVLDKISTSGYDSLTREEKELLFKMGK